MANPLQMLQLKPTNIQFITETLIAAAPKKVWATLIKPGNWFYFDADRRGKHTFELKPGGQWTSVYPDGTAMLMGTITYIEPGKLIRIGGQLGMTHLPTSNVLIFELQPKGDKTLLRVGTRMFGALDKDVKKRFTGAWSMLLGQLKTTAEG